MTDLTKVFDLANLRRAYRWTQSNPDARYKSYFRDSYSAFAIASDSALRRIRSDGLASRYSPEHASKIMMPKASGTLRPITLLTVQDQIVYQAVVNVIADTLKPKTAHRYRRRVFAHLYAGKASPFFNLKWQDSYRLMAKRIRALHAQGFSYVANFDLASFYDSIDHQVLRHFLLEIGLQQELIDFLLECLKRWTSSTWSTGRDTIYHGHGIPQGPLPSGMLSEVVLQHIDRAGERGRQTSYIRYVDDIKLFAKAEDHLRRKLVALDLASRDIGLFPQTSKINLRRFSDPNTEIKSISIPPEPSLIPAVDQKKLVSRLMQITRKGRVDSALSTRFKYLLGRAIPSHRLNTRLMQVLKHHPDYAETVAAYISRYKSLPDKFADQVLDYVRRNELYHSVNGSIFRACIGHLSPNKAAAFGAFAKIRLTQTGGLPLQPVYKEALVAWMIEARLWSFTEMEAANAAEKDWWVRKSIFRQLVPNQYGTPSYGHFLNDCMRVPEEEVSRCAVARLIEYQLSLRKPYGDASDHAKILLKAAKIIRATGKPNSLINPILAYILKQPETPYDWPKLFGREHKHAELMAVVIKQSHESDIDAFIVRLDSFADKLTEILFMRLCPGSQYPAFGTAIRNPTLVRSLPKTMASFQSLHSLRLQSVTAHPRSKSSGSATRRLKHRDYYGIRRSLIQAFTEVEHVVTP